MKISSLKIFTIHTLFLIVCCFMGNSQHKEIPIDSIYILRKQSRNDLKYTSEQRLAFAQRSLELAKLTKVDTTILWSNMRLAGVHYTIGNYDLDLYLSHKNLKKAQELNDKKALNSILIDLGDFYDFMGKRDSAYFYFIKAKELNYPSDIDYCIYLGLASVQASVNDFLKCEENSIRGLKLLKQIPETRRSLVSHWEAYNRLGSTFSQQGQNKKALAYYKKAIGISERMLNRNFYKYGRSAQAYTYNNIAEVYQQQQDYSRALAFYQKALSNNTIFNEDPSFYPFVLNNINYTEFLIGTKNRDDIIAEIKSSLKTCDTLKDTYDKRLTQMGCSLYLTKIYRSEQQLDSAYKYAKQAYKLSKSIQENEYVFDALMLLSDLEETEASKAYLKAYITLRDSINKQERLMRNKFARIEYESDLLEANNQQLAREKKWLYGITIGVLGLSLLIFIILIQYSKHKRLKFAKSQQKANEHIYGLMLSQRQILEEGRLQERERVSEELHDGILNKLFGTRMGLSFLDLKGNTADLKKFGKYLDQINSIEKDLRLLSHNLKTSELSEENDFNQILKDLLNKQTELYQITFLYNSSSRLDWKSISDKIKVNLYRIIQEALHNTVKHSKAKAVTVELTMEEQHLALIISDNGKGFNPNRVRKGIGLKNIASRIKTLQGTFNLESELSRGTTIRALVPL